MSDKLEKNPWKFAESAESYWDASEKWRFQILLKMVQFADAVGKAVGVVVAVVLVGLVDYTIGSCKS